MKIGEIFDATLLCHITRLRVDEVPFRDVRWAFELANESNGYLGSFSSYDELERSMLVVGGIDSLPILKYILFGYIVMKNKIGVTDKRVFGLLLANLEELLGDFEELSSEIRVYTEYLRQVIE